MLEELDFFFFDFEAGVGLGVASELVLVLGSSGAIIAGVDVGAGGGTESEIVDGVL